MDWPTFWAAVEALATAGALLFILLELPKFWKEMAARKVEGLRFAREQLEAQDFQDRSEIIIDSWKASSNEYPEMITGYIVNALVRIDFVAKLIELGYGDKDLLFYLYADNLFLFERAITSFEHRKNSKIPGIRASFPRGFVLLKEAAKASSAERKKSFERLNTTQEASLENHHSYK